MIRFETDDDREDADLFEVARDARTFVGPLCGERLQMGNGGSNCSFPADHAGDHSWRNLVEPTDALSELDF